MKWALLLVLGLGALVGFAARGTDHESQGKIYTALVWAMLWVVLLILLSFNSFSPAGGSP